MSQGKADTNMEGRVDTPPRLQKILTRDQKKQHASQRRYWCIIFVVLTATLACVRPSANQRPPWIVSQAQPVEIYPPPSTPTEISYRPALRNTTDPILTPTPDPLRILPTARVESEEYVVQAGDTLGIIAQRYGINLEALIQANELANPNILSIGEILTVPPPELDRSGPSFKVIPDSELIYGPLSTNFDLARFVAEKGGYLSRYSEDVEGQSLSGTQIIQRIAEDFSVNPRLLLAVLEYQSGWVTQPEPRPETLDYPIVRREEWRKGLYLQLAFAANNLNRGYYSWKVNGVGTWLTTNGANIPIDPTINAGTAAVQSLFALIYDRASWDIAVTEEGLFATYLSLFGYPFDWAIEPLLPPGLYQPTMQLPFESGVVWAFTGGPHGGWGDGSAWAALDFAPPGNVMGCIQSDAWVVAIADGPVLRASNGAVIQDVDGYNGQPADGREQTGWVILYMHIETRDRVQAGAYLSAGDRIGHPSCEGGFSSGTHVHLARRYNGEWIPADQTLPFVMDGWISRGAGIEYNGTMEREGDIVEAWEGYFPENQISR
jgi:murein DD-endopeptidase MepM/ murein hydrolase activator NlpD